METLEKLKNRLIDQIIVTQSEELLHAVEILLKSNPSEKSFKLSSRQIEILKMSEEDIEKGRIISEDDLLESDSKWMD